MIQLIIFLKKCLQRRDAIQEFITSEEENEALAYKWMDEDEQQHADDYALVDEQFANHLAKLREEGLDAEPYDEFGNPIIEEMDDASFIFDDEPEDILDESNYNFEG